MGTMLVPDCVILTPAGPLGCMVDAETVEARRSVDPNGYIDVRLLVQAPGGQPEEKQARLRADSVIAIF